MDNVLEWNLHHDYLSKSMFGIHNGIMIIRRELSYKQTLMIVTAHAMSILYYGDAAW